MDPVTRAVDEVRAGTQSLLFAVAQTSYSGWSSSSLSSRTSVRNSLTRLRETAQAFKRRVETDHAEGSVGDRAAVFETPRRDLSRAAVEVFSEALTNRGFVCDPVLPGHSRLWPETRRAAKSGTTVLGATSTTTTKYLNNLPHTKRGVQIQFPDMKCDIDWIRGEPRVRCVDDLGRVLRKRERAAKRALFEGRHRSDDLRAARCVKKLVEYMERKSLEKNAVEQEEEGEEVAA